MTRRIGRGLALSGLLLAACSNDTGPEGGIQCSIPAGEIIDGGVSRDGIPALTSPTVISASEATYLLPNDRVLGFVANGEARAYPFPILWWHEIVNDAVGGEEILITYCPLTGSGIAFDPAPAGQSFNYGVSGLLFFNNLMMFDRTTGSLWPQMFHGAGCGDLVGTDLTLKPIVETTWEKWKELHPNTTVLSDETGFNRDYGLYPYGNYRQFETPPFFPQAIDTRRPPKEPVLGVFEGSQRVAYPFIELLELGDPIGVVNDNLTGRSIAVFFDPNSLTAIAYDREVGGQTLSFQRSPSGEIVDDQTGSTWSLLGEAIAGPSAGARLTPVSQAYVVFWFAWATFNTNTRIWTP